MKNLKILAFALLLISGKTYFAQELGNGYYNYILNPFNVNPAHISDEDQISVLLNTMNQRTSIDNAPRNVMFGLNVPINMQQAVGLRVISDRRGVFELSKYDFTYSHKFKLNHNSSLRLGVSAGVLRRSLNISNIGNIEYLDQADFTLAGDYFDQTNFIAGTGIVYKLKNFEVGASSPHLVIDGEISDFLIGHINYKLDIGQSDFDLIPMVIIQNIPNIGNRVDGLLKADYKDRAWLQLGGQSTENLHFGLGFNFGNFGIGYTYQMSNNILEQAAMGSNEILLQIKFSKNKEVKESSVLVKLDEYISRLQVILEDEKDLFTTEFVQNEIRRIQVDLIGLQKQTAEEKLQRRIDQKINKINLLIVKLKVKYEN